MVAKMNGGSEIVEDSHAVGRVRHELTKLENEGEREVHVES